MATTAAVLSILVDANTTQATSKLSKFDKQLEAVNSTAKKGIETRLGGAYNPQAFDRYERAMTNATRRAKDRAAFRAELGANFNPRAFNQYERAVERADMASKTATKNTRTMSDAFGGAATAVLGWGKKLAEGAAAAAAGSVYAAIKFQSATEVLQTQAGASTKQVEELRKGILKMASDVGQTPDKLAAGMYHVVSSMNALLPPAKRVSAELHIQKIAAEGAAVGHSDLEETTYALASAMNALHAPVTDAQKVMGDMNAIVGAGDMTMSDLLDTMKSGIVPAARTFGISFRSVGAALAVMGDMGIRGAAAGTRLRMSIALLGAPSAAAAKILKAMGLSTDQVTAAQSRMSGLLVKAGITTTQLADDLRKPNGLRAALVDLKQRLIDGGLSAEAASATISRAFGGGRSGATIQLLLQNTDRLNAKFHQIAKTSGDFGNAFDQTKKTVVFQLHALEAGVISLGIRFGDMLLPKVRDVVRVLSQFVKQMQSGKGAGGEFVNVLKGIWNVTKSLVGDFGKLVKLFKESNPYVVALAGAIAGAAAALIAYRVGLIVATAAQIAFDAAVTANPYVAAAVGIAALIGALVLLYEKSKPVRKAINEIGHAISTVFRAAVRVATPVIHGLWNVVQGVLKAIKGTIEFFSAAFKGDFGKMWKAIKLMFSGALQAIIGIVESEFGALFEAGKEIMHAIGHGMEAGASAVVNVVIDVVNKAIGVLNGAIGAINDVLSVIPGAGSIGKIGTVGHVNFAGGGGSGKAASAADTLAAQGVGERLRTHGHHLGRFPTAPVDTRGHHLGGFPGGGGGGGGGSGGGGGGGDGGSARTQHAAAHQQAAAAARQHAAAVRQHAAAVAQQAAARAQAAAARAQAAFLAFWARIPSQAAGQQIKSAQIANRLQLATNAGNVGGQTKALNAERRLDKQWIAEDKRKLKKLNGQLARKGLSRKTRNALLQDKLGLIQEITTIEADIGNVATSLQSLGGSTGGFDLMPGSVTLPTPYDVRHSIGSHTHHHNNHITIHVNKDADVTKVADVIDRTMNSQIHSRLRRAGLRGT